MMKRTAFVTGGTGFIGINLIKLLIDQNWQVTALHRKNSNRSPLQHLPVSWVKGSVIDGKAIAEAIPNQIDTVFHLAGDTSLWSHHNERQRAVNIKGTEILAQTAARKNVSAFIHTSSTAAWGEVSGRITEDTLQKGKNSWINYEHTKWAGERRALAGLDNGMKVVILNPANVIGPHDIKNWGRLFQAVCKKNLRFISEGCISVAHVSEVAKANIAAFEEGKPGERYILAGNKRSFPEFVKIIADVGNIKKLPAVIPATVFRSYARLLSFKALFSQKKPDITPELAKIMTRQDVTYSSQKAIGELGYSIPPVQKSVEDCYHWLRKEDMI